MNDNGFFNKLSVSLLSELIDKEDTRRFNERLAELKYNINLSLIEGNKDVFMALTSEYKQMVWEA